MKLEITKERKTTLLTAIVVFVLGALLFTNPDMVIKSISYICGALFALYGGYSIYTYTKTKLNTSLVSGIIGIILALVFIFLAGVIEATIRYLIGAWILFSGITRLIYAVSYMDRTDNRFVSSLIVSILLIILGFYIILVSNLVLSTIGILLMVYAGIEIVGYIFDVVEGRKNVKPKEEIKDAVVVSKQPKKKNKKQNKKVD